MPALAWLPAEDQAAVRRFGADAHCLDLRADRAALRGLRRAGGPGLSPRATVGERQADRRLKAKETLGGAALNRLRLPAISTALALLFAEVCLHMATQRSSFEAPDTDAYGFARLRESAPGNRRHADAIVFDDERGWRSKSGFETGGRVHHSPGGVRGYGTGQQVLLWEREGMRYRPDREACSSL